VLHQLEGVLEGRPVDLVISDMAPNLSGVASADAARIEHICDLALEFAQNHLKPEGALLVKCFHGSGYSQIVEKFKQQFKVVAPRKPKASRDKSSETFIGSAAEASAVTRSGMPQTGSGPCQTSAALSALSMLMAGVVGLD
jgi:23S rRNA (uridine2552-2'-O)-methyltransferase